ncbi:Nramp family divalent metal transporter [Ichthyenterobacterium sp. W332]|uniref:Nramp family divalent metal transporter n=1 Tax=Microcosmobacter mediterraneus TaxID=3075607 RepID=A0ABU2YKU1_9FLAO|nr:Nramp family divalent metal transporter [Ichthyenterobacterium sp. W332]MDT0558766.1 Nramp family divalent metal transporter [Ichthyenterobacterium sp. W332]
MIKKWMQSIGPGPLIAAAFIGPGTVTVCTLAGADFGYALIWAMLISVVATVVLQEMSARLGIVSQRGLSEVIKSEIKNTFFKRITILLIISAIVIGNAAYEAGNITGAVLGLESIFGNHIFELGSVSLNYFSVFIGFLAFLLLYFGNYKMLEKVLISLVILMSIAFVSTAIITKPDLTSIAKGIFSFKAPKGSLLTIIALIGTTVVPYNIFLHSALVKEKWKNAKDLKLARRDTIIAIVLGGFVSMSIIICAATINVNELNSASDLALALEPLFGDNAKYLLSIGLFSAGITSAVTAPLAAAYVATGCLGWSTNLNTKRFRLIWIVVLLLGVIFSSTSIKPILIIKFAQIANGLLLPIVAILLLWIMNKSSILGKHKNTLFNNSISFIIVIMTVFVGLKGILKVLSLI